MILPDVNVLIYAFREELAHHIEAKSWLETVLAGDEDFGIWDVTLASAYRILTNPKILPGNTDPALVLGYLNRIRQAPASVRVETSELFWSDFESLLITHQVKAALTSDAMLAALAISLGARLATFDRDFEQFTGLTCFKPSVPTN